MANWKMEMTIVESLAYLRRFQEQAGRLTTQVQVILCPPYTSLYPMAQALGASPIELGVQTVSAAAGGARTGEVSAQLVADAGARWALLGHWELRRHMGETDEMVNHKVHRALEAGLRPMLLVGEACDVGAELVGTALGRQLACVLDGCSTEQVAAMVIVYEPESTIGVTEPAPPDHIHAGCRWIRHWLATHLGGDTAQAVRILYGGSVSPASARNLLALPDVDGFGASRKGRDPDAFCELVQLIAQARSPGG
jgi:triosephosphate isomerase